MSRALLIEDGTELREFLAELLAGAGYTVTAAASWGAALPALESCPDIILMSRTVSREGPEVFLAEVRRRDLVARVILLTSVIDEEELRRLGISHVLPKPMSVVRLREILRLCRENGMGSLPVTCAGLEASRAAEAPGDYGLGRNVVSRTDMSDLPPDKS